MGDTENLKPCGCCEKDKPMPLHFNRPGMLALDYRVATHSAFLKHMISLMPRWSLPDGENRGSRPMAGFSTRDTGDPSIAIMDAWAVVCDVLTFYQERIANEGFIRTATERRSILELARDIGYELSPGVAAKAFLAFTAEDAPGSPGFSFVPLGTKIQSIPGQGELPQVFETGKDIVARVEWNALQLRVSRPQKLGIRWDDDKTSGKLCILGLDTRFAEDTPDLKDAGVEVSKIYPLDPNLELPDKGKVQAIEVRTIYLKGVDYRISIGDKIMLLGARSDDLKILFQTVNTVKVERELLRTRLDLGEEPVVEMPKPLVHILRLPKFAKITLQTVKLNESAVQGIIKAGTWRESDLSAFFSIQGWDRCSVAKNVNLRLKETPAKTPPKIDKRADAGIYSFGEKVGAFGHNAQRFASLISNSIAFHDWDSTISPFDVWQDSVNYNNEGSPRFYRESFEVDLFLERSIPGILSDSWIVLSAGANQEFYKVEASMEASPAGFAMSGKATGLQLKNRSGASLCTDAEDDDFRSFRSSSFTLRRTTIYAKSERLELAELPVEEPLAAGTTEVQLDRMILGLGKDQPLIISGERDDLPGVTAREVVIVSEVLHSGGYTMLIFEPELEHSYVRKTVTINANVASATHGETVEEVLGSGDGSIENQRFYIKKLPLTYVSAPNPDGRESTLKLRVNGILWKETPRLYGLDEKSESYIIRIDEDGKTSVVFGDGRMGARPPTGFENVTATFRSGIGLPGMIDADKLTLLKSRPLGIRSVINPLPTSDAAAPEDRDKARYNAPRTVLTLDRIVSLNDFEDFASIFTGIGKAQAVTLIRDEITMIHLTIASQLPTKVGDAGDKALATHVIESTSGLYENLMKAIKGACDISQAFAVDSYQPLFFNLSVDIRVDPRFRASTVLAEVEEALKIAFSFERRDFGQPVTSAEVISIIQNVPGVIAVDLDKLYNVDEPPEEDEPPALILSADRFYMEDGQKHLAQLLLINPVGIDLQEVKP